MKTVSKMDAMRMIYYLMAIDGITDDEIKSFEEIGQELDATFLNYKDMVINECDHVIATIEEDQVEVLQEAIDAALYKEDEGEKDNVLSARMLVWNLLVIANADSDYSEDEKKLIRHVARVCKIDKSVLQEMEQSIQTSRAIDKELAYLETSTKPYNEIRPLVDEMEKRRQVVRDSIIALIEDDVEAEEEYIPEEKKKILGDSMAKMQEKLAPMSEQIVTGTKKATEQVMQGTRVAAEGMLGRFTKKGDK